MKEAVAHQNMHWQREGLFLQKELSPAKNIQALRPWQETAFNNFLGRGFPNRFDEEWKYTPITKLMDQPFTLAVKPKEASLSVNFISGAFRVVFIDGFFRPEFSDLPQEIILSTTLSMLDNPIYRDFLFIEPLYENAFTDLNAALLTDGLFIIVPENYVLKHPIHFIYYHSGHETSLMCHPRHIIWGRKNSSFTLVEEYVGEEDVYFNNVVTHLQAEAGAMMTHYKIQNESRKAIHLANTIVTQARDSTVFSYVISKGAHLSRDNLNFHLREMNTSSHLYGLYLPQEGQCIDHHTRVDHQFPHCFSQQNYKGIIAKNSQAVFNGKVVVAKNAAKTIALQSNKNILLESNAQVDTKPQLEIYAEDVKCSHAATVGQLDQDALFYLRSRGIAESIARQLLLKGFAEEIFSTISHENILHYLQSGDALGEVRDYE